jgi:hypothetical protein
MKILYHLLGFVFVITIISACHNTATEKNDSIFFGIYSTYNLDDVPLDFRTSLNQPGFIPENNTSMSIIGYKPMNDTIPLLQYNDGNFGLFETHYTVDNNHQYKAVIALERYPSLSNGDLKNCRNIDGNVELLMNESGKAKWSEFTKSNKGKRVALVIGEYIYTLPYINYEIVSGIAMVSGINNDSIADLMIDRLNSSVKMKINSD